MRKISHKTEAWNPKLYDGNHQYVSAFGESLLDDLAPKKGEKICDIGCGTGDLAKKISDTGASVIGIDSAVSDDRASEKKVSRNSI